MPILKNPRHKAFAQALARVRSARGKFNVSIAVLCSPVCAGIVSARSCMEKSLRLRGRLLVHDGAASIFGHRGLDPNTSLSQVIFAPPSKLCVSTQSNLGDSTKCSPCLV
jgi:hypothetical protein